MDESIQPAEEMRGKTRHSFLLRLWCANAHSPSNWQASLEDSHTHERIGFGDLEHLFAYLMELSEMENSQRMQ